MLQLRHFIKYPYSIAAASWLFHVPTGLTLWFIAVASAIVSVWLTAWMFGTVAAGYFAFTNLAWVQFAFLGGSEPLAMAVGVRCWRFGGIAFCLPRSLRL